MSEEIKQQVSMAETGRGFMAAAAGWIVPGLGHAILKRWGSAAVAFISVSVLAILGMAMRGNVFPSSSVDPFDRLGFFADLGTGAYYFLSKTFEASGPECSARGRRLRYDADRHRRRAEHAVHARSIRHWAQNQAVTRARERNF